MYFVTISILLLLPTLALAFPHAPEDELDAFLGQQPLHTAVLLAGNPTPTPASDKTLKPAWGRHRSHDIDLETRMARDKLRQRVEQWARDSDDDD